jgi:hypothetical protein
MRALRSPEWLVVDGAIEGLSASGNFPDKAAGQLAGLLSHEDENIRGTAARGLSVMKEHAVSALAPLLQRLGEETSMDVCGRLIPEGHGLFETLWIWHVAIVPNMLQRNCLGIEPVSSFVATAGGGCICDFLPEMASSIGGVLPASVKNFYSAD